MQKHFESGNSLDFLKKLEVGKMTFLHFSGYSMICLHLWCLWKYWPDEGRKRGECPCHGSMYDPLTGTAFVGPASVQAAPSDTLPKLNFEIDSVWICFWILATKVGMRMTME